MPLPQLIHRDTFWRCLKPTQSSPMIFGTSETHLVTSVNRRTLFMSYASWSQTDGRSVETFGLLKMKPWVTKMPENSLIQLAHGKRFNSMNARNGWKTNLRRSITIAVPSNLIHISDFKSHSQTFWCSLQKDTLRWDWNLLEKTSAKFFYWSKRPHLTFTEVLGFWPEYIRRQMVELHLGEIHFPIPQFVYLSKDCLSIAAIHYQEQKPDQFERQVTFNQILVRRSVRCTMKRGKFESENMHDLEKEKANEAVLCGQGVKRHALSALFTPFCTDFGVEGLNMVWKVFCDHHIVFRIVWYFAAEHGSFS